MFRLVTSQFNSFKFPINVGHSRVDPFNFLVEVVASWFDPTRFYIKVGHLLSWPI
jgi:hypothetical protein